MNFLCMLINVKLTHKNITLVQKKNRNWCIEHSDCLNSKNYTLIFKTAGKQRIVQSAVHHFVKKKKTLFLNQSLYRKFSVNIWVFTANILFLYETRTQMNKHYLIYLLNYNILFMF